MTSDVGKQIMDLAEKKNIGIKILTFATTGERHFMGRKRPVEQTADFAGIKPWFGYRPVSPDGLPYIGRFGRPANLTAACGHAMLGLTLAPITGLLVAEILTGRKPSVDLTMLDPNRYA